MKKAQKRRAGRGENSPRRESKHLAPGKMTRTSRLATDTAWVQRRSAAAETGAPHPKTKLASEWTNDPWMDAAHRGTIPPAESPIIQRQESDEQRQEQDETPSSCEERAEAIYDAFHGSSWSDDEAKALAQIRGQSLDELRQIRRHYSKKYQRKLETEYREYCNASETKAALAILFPILPIQDKLSLESNQGIFGTENEGAIVEILKTSSVGELAVLSADTSIMSDLEDWLSAQEYYEALKLIRPGQMYENVKWRIEHAEGTFNDDESAVYRTLLELSSNDRKRMWVSEAEIFSFLSESERESVRVLCTGTEADALSEGMRLATENAGTDDPLVAQVIVSTATATVRGRKLRDELATDDVSDDRRSEIEAALAQLGDLNGTLLQAEYVDGELREGSFLERLEGDVSDGEFEAFTKNMGVSDFYRAKQMILGAPDLLNDDEDAVYRAFETIGDQSLRDALMADEDVKAALADAFNEDETKSLAGFVEGNSYEIALHKLEEAYRGIDTNENEIFQILLSMSADDRELLKSRKPQIYIDLTTDMDSDEIPLVNEAINTGRISTDAALDYAMGGDWDGTNEELIRQTFERMTAEERKTYRLGYVLSKGGAVSEEFADVATQEQALVAFSSLRRRLSDELGTDDLQEPLDRLLGGPSLDEVGSEPGREMATTIMHNRVLEKGEIRDESAISSRFVDLFSETGVVADQSEVAFRSAYHLAVENGEVSDLELVMLGALKQNFDQHYAEHVAAVDQVTEIASTVAAIAVAVAAVIATGGAATPGASAVLAKLGVGSKVAIAATAAGVAKLGVAETVGGKHHDAVSTEGLTNLTVGGVEGAIAVLSAGIANSLAKSFQAYIGLRGAALTSQMTVAATRAGNTGLRALGSRAAMGGLEGAIDGALSGAVGELVMTALDEETWRRTVWDASLRFGWSIIRGVSIGAATGAVTGGLLESLAHALSVRRFNRLLQHLESTGQSLDDLDNLTLSQVRTLGDIDRTVGRGELAAAEETFEQLGSQLDDGLADALRRVLFENSPRTVDELSEAIRGRVLMNSDKFSLRYSNREMRRIIEHGREKGLTEDQIEDLIFVGCRRDKPISADDLTRQMDHYVSQILGEGFPFRFASKEQFEQFKADLRTRLEGLGLPTNDVRVQGSALRNPDAADVDIAVFMEPATFNQKLSEFFGGRVKLNGAKIDIPTTGEGLEALAAKIAADAAGPKQYNAPARSLMYAIQHNKLRPQDVPGLRSAKNALQGTFGEFDISVIVRGQEFDLHPFLQIGGSR